jgi:methyl-accepting chemotaxis protein
MSAAKTLAKLVDNDDRHDAMGQMDGVVQRNSALVEQAAAAADALQRQALALAEAVGVFRVAGDARGNVLRIR